MDADYSQLIEQWKMFKGNISLCGSKFICQNSESFLNSKDLEWQLRDARENLKEISDLCKEISKIYEKLERSYVKNAKRFSI